MSQRKKARCDSNLKNLPEERQQEIFEYAAEHGLVKCAAWLREDGLETSKSAVGNFCRWYPLQAQFRADEQTTDSVLEQVKKEATQLTDEQLDIIGQRTFSLLALRREDSKTFLAYRTALNEAKFELAKIELRRQAEERLKGKAALEKEKWVVESCEKILKAATDSKTREIAALSVPNSEKIALLRKHWFADVDELEKSGGVKLPE